MQMSPCSAMTKSFHYPNFIHDIRRSFKLARGCYHCNNWKNVFYVDVRTFDKTLCLLARAVPRKKFRGYVTYR